LLVTKYTLHSIYGYYYQEPDIYKAYTHSLPYSERKALFSYAEFSYISSLFHVVRNATSKERGGCIKEKSNLKHTSEAKFLLNSEEKLSSLKIL